MNPRPSIAHALAITIVLGFVAAAALVVLRSHRFRHGPAVEECAAHLRHLYGLAEHRRTALG